MPNDKLEDHAKKRLKEGWIKSWMMIEVVAITPEAARSALEKHVEALEKFEKQKSLVVRKAYGEVKEVPKPLPDIEKGHALVVELEMLTQNYETLFLIVLNYGPSAIEILEPGRISMDAGEAQGILNGLADVLHRFAAMKAGGMIIKT